MSNFLGTFCIGVPNFLFGRGGATPFPSIKPSMSNHGNSRIVDGRIIYFMRVCQLFSLLLVDFLFENFLSIEVSIETLKKVFTIVW